MHSFGQVVAHELRVSEHAPNVSAVLHLVGGIGQRPRRFFGTIALEQQLRERDVSAELLGREGDRLLEGGLRIVQVRELRPRHGRTRD